MLSATFGPMVGMAMSSSRLARASLSRLSKCWTRRSAVSDPTCLMPRAKITLERGRLLLFSMELITLEALFSPMRSSPASCSFFR